MNQTLISIAGIDIAPLEHQQDLLDALFEQLGELGWAFAIAINPEKIIASMTDPELKMILERCTLRYADGIGVVKAVKRKTGINIPRIPGCEVWEALMEEAGKRQAPVFLVGAKPEVIEQTRLKLKEQYNTPIIDYQDGYFTDQNAVITRIKNSGAQIVTVALGSPRQEKFILACHSAGIHAIFMGVGGSYDVFTGHVKRAPAFWQRLGLEWFYRLACQPSRLFRQRKLLTFLWLMLTNKL